MKDEQNSGRESEKNSKTHQIFEEKRGCQQNQRTVTEKVFTKSKESCGCSWILLQLKEREHLWDDSWEMKLNLETIDVVNWQKLLKKRSNEHCGIDSYGHKDKIKKGMMMGECRQM